MVTSKHVLGNMDKENNKVTCLHCGLVEIKWVWDKEKYKARCSIGYKEQKTKWHEKNRDYRSPSSRNSGNVNAVGTHGLTRLQAREFKFGKVCAICGTTGWLVIDHDHETGKIRGVLCNPCNVGLGMFVDDMYLLQFALDYLEENGKSGPNQLEE